MTSIITDWRTKDEDALPELAFGEDYERRITPQMFVVMHRIILQGRFLHLVSLRVGALSDVPFELEHEEDGVEVHHYRPKGVNQEPIKQLLVNTGAAAVGSNAIAIPPGMDVLLVVRNGGAEPAKPRAAILVQEERA